MQEYFKQYRLIKQISETSSRSVYFAHHTDDPSQQVVLEIFPEDGVQRHELGPDGTRATICPDDSELFEKIKTLKHPLILPVMDFGIEQRQPYIIRQDLPGNSLRQRLDELAPRHLDRQEALKIILQVGKALSYAHRQGVLHGQIGPEHIFFNAKGDALLADFGLAQQSAKEDQHALACLTRELIPDLPEAVNEVIRKAMSNDPAKRYADVSIFLHALKIASQSPLYEDKSGKASNPVAKPFSNAALVKPLSDIPIPRPLSDVAFPFAKPLSSVPLDKPLSSVPLAKPLSDGTLAKPLSALPFAKPLSSVPLAKPLSNLPLVKQLSESSLAMRFLSNHGQDKAWPISASGALIENPSAAGLIRPHKPFSPFWLAFALSGLLLFMGTAGLYALLPSRPVKSSKLAAQHRLAAQPSAPALAPPTQSLAQVGQHPSTVRPFLKTTGTSVTQPISLTATTIATLTVPAAVTNKGYEAADPQNTLTGTATVTDCASCSDGKMVSNLGKDGILQFNNISESLDGNYLLTLYYLHATMKNGLALISVNSNMEAQPLYLPATGDGDTIGSVSITVHLHAGNNTLKVFNPGGTMPDIERITLS